VSYRTVGAPGRPEVDPALSVLLLAKGGSMLETIQSYLPIEWRRTAEFLGAPIWWIPAWQSKVLALSLTGNAGLDTVLRQVFLLLPVLLVIVGVWITMVALYTIPFRSNRGRFATTLMLSWWDAGRSVWFFWAGEVRMLVVLLGWVWNGLKLVWRLTTNTIKMVFNSPFMLLDWTSRRYFKPGMPWIAFLLVLAWSALEAVIFTYTLQPTLNEVLANITGFEPNRAIVTPVLWALLFVLIAGSFACVRMLALAIEQRRPGQIVQMAFVEMFVMFFEVVFLYRELIDAITPWIAQQTGGDLRLGLASTLSLAAFGWIGVRGMTWFLFGRYGTPALLAVLSRETLTQDAAAVPAPPAVETGVFRDVVRAFKEESAWFKREGTYIFELLSLPILQLLAAAVNFSVVIFRADPVFPLPFRELDDVLEVVSFGNGDRLTRRSKAAKSATATPAGVTS
jgi:hypothetical protein